ncbi:hypothetical protein ACFFJN_02070 [Erwinia mallotivora]|uniref:hypothetical protein n=1 Tax=Erwinia mallotivora TaxID=69222 RepID=UPI0035E773E1
MRSASLLLGHNPTAATLSADHQHKETWLSIGPQQHRLLTGNIAGSGRKGLQRLWQDESTENARPAPLSARDNGERRIKSSLFLPSALLLIIFKQKSFYKPGKKTILSG